MSKTPKQETQPSSVGVWTRADAEAYRAEVERRFRERTPPKPTDGVEDPHRQEGTVT